MEQIFANLYRLSQNDGNRTEHSYLIVRDGGNVLVPGYVPSLLDHLDQIEKLGGVSRQFVTHVHDVRDEIHRQLFDRFGCKLVFHKAANSVVRKKTECPCEVFDHDGLHLDADFEAIYFPGHTPGHSIFRWTHEGTQFLFTGHVMRFEDDRWKLNYNPTKAPRGTDFDHLVSADHILPTCRFGADDLYTMDKRTRSLFEMAVHEAWEKPKPSDRDVF